MNLRALIVDDEAPARRRLARLLDELPDVEVIGEADEARAAAALIDRLSPHVVFLDIRMPGEDGLSLAERYRERVSIVFVTAHAEHAARAFDLDSHDYLLKPVRLARLEEALRRVRSRRRPTAEAPVRVMAHEKGATVLVDAAAVTRFRAVDKYTAFLADGRELLTEESLVALEGRLAACGFMRVHRSELVRLSAIRRFRSIGGEHTVDLEDGQQVPVSRRLAATLRTKLGL